MKRLYSAALFGLLSAFVLSCNGQPANNQTHASNTPGDTQAVGGRCDGCELMYAGMPKNINPVDTSSGWKEEGQKLLVTGTVYKKDGKTPAPNTIIYYYHTDNNGYYSPKDGMDEKAKRHGHIRGWVKSGEQGKYAIYTIRPAPYPNGKAPAHIHIFIKEPNINEYYIDEFVFDDDKLLNGSQRKNLVNRGGSGILEVQVSNGLQVAEHNIVLGLNIPGYPG